MRKGKVKHFLLDEKQKSNWYQKIITIKGMLVFLFLFIKSIGRCDVIEKIHNVIVFLNYQRASCFL